MLVLVTAEEEYIPTEIDMTDAQGIASTEKITTDLITGLKADEDEVTVTALPTETIAILFEEVGTSESVSASGKTFKSSDELEEAIKAEESSDEVLSTFSCFGRSFGQYADVSQDCRVFHLCYPYFNETSDELLYQRITFLCDNDSIFDQKRFICTENKTIDHRCHESEALYQTSNQEYLIRVFSQSVSANSEEVDRSAKSDESPRGWFSWFARH